MSLDTLLQNARQTATKPKICSRKSTLHSSTMYTYLSAYGKCSISAGAKSKVKSSVQRAIRAKIVETYPLLGPHIDEIIPKKSQLDVLKL